MCKFERSDLRAEVVWWSPQLKEFCPVLEHWKKFSQYVAQYCAPRYLMLSQI